MKLLELYKLQKQFRDRIDYQGEDRAKCIFTEFWVELGECANEWRGFKYWSKSRWKPNTLTMRKDYGEIELKPFNPLLDEYTDGFTILIDLGLEFNHTPHELWAYMPSTESLKWTTLEQFDAVLDSFMRFKKEPKEFILYEQLMQVYLGLGQMLGFSETQIRDGYLTKNKVNHERQEAGY